MSLIACAKLQEDLDNNFIAGNPTVATQPTGLTKFLLSSLNTSGVLQSKIDSKGGKLRQVELLYTPQYLESEISTSSVKKCTSTNEKGQLSTTYSMTQSAGVQVDELFDIGNMAAMCKDNSLWFAQRIQAMMDGLYNKMSTVVATQTVALTGKFAVGDLDQDGTGIVGDQKIISTRKADKTIDPIGYTEIVFSAQNASYPSVPFVFGFGETDKYFKGINAGCCNSSGFNIEAFAAQNDLVYMADKKVSTALGSPTGFEFLTLAAGAAQILTWNEFTGDFNVSMDDSYKQTVIQDPKTGIVYDMQLKNDCGNIAVSLKLAFKVVGLPADMFAVGDNFEGVTYINKYQITNP